MQTPVGKSHRDLAGRTMSSGSFGLTTLVTSLTPKLRADARGVLEGTGLRPGPTPKRIDCKPRAAPYRASGGYLRLLEVFDQWASAHEAHIVVISAASSTSVDERERSAVALSASP